MLAWTGPSSGSLAKRSRSCSPVESRCDCGSCDGNPASSAASARSEIGNCWHRCGTRRRSFLQVI